MAKQPSTHIEQWLIVIAEKLRSSNLNAVLLYEDRYQGNELSLSMTTPEGFACLFVHRSAARRASLLFVAESVAVVKVLGDLLRDLHKGVSRFENAKRKFLHRVERMLGLLRESFTVRANEFPLQALEKVKALFPTAVPMTGAEARFREKDHDDSIVELESEDLSEKEEKRYPTCYAIKTQLADRAYASLYNGTTKNFICKGPVVLEALQLLERLRAPESQFAVTLGVAPVIDPLNESNLRGRRGSSSTSTSSSWYCDIVPDCGNVGGCDLPDCDLPDCSMPDIDLSGCDPGGCDIGGCDFS